METLTQGPVEAGGRRNVPRQSTPAESCFQVFTGDMRVGQSHNELAFQSRPSPSCTLERQKLDVYYQPLTNCAPPGSLPASKPCCAGTARSSGLTSCPATSSVWPRNPASSFPSASGCFASPVDEIGMLEQKASAPLLPVRQLVPHRGSSSRTCPRSSHVRLRKSGQ